MHRFQMAEEETCQQHAECAMDGTPETIEHFILHCPAYQVARTELCRRLTEIGVSVVDIKTLLLGLEVGAEKQQKIAHILLEYLYSTDRVDRKF